MLLHAPYQHVQEPAAPSKSLGQPRDRHWLTATSHRKRMIFWLCCKQRQHSYQFSWGLNSLQLTSDDPSVLATAMLVPPWCDTKGQHWCPQRHQAQVSSLCPHVRPGACPKATAILAAWCTCQPHENQPLAHLHHPQSPVAEVVLYHTKKSKNLPKNLLQPIRCSGKKTKGYVFNPVYFHHLHFW